MKTFPLIISSPSGELFRNQAVKISLRGVEGDLAVMAGHTPFITTVKPCDCTVFLEDGTTKIGNIENGILNVSREVVTLLSGSFAWK